MSNRLSSFIPLAPEITQVNIASQFPRDTIKVPLPEMTHSEKLEKAEFDAKERKDLAKKKEAMPGGQFPIRNVCLSGNTLIPLLNGEIKPIKNLKKGDWIYSFDLVTKSIVPGEISKVMLTKKNASVLRVTLDSGASVVCTGNHPFLMRNGEYKEAKDLKENDSLMPLYRKKTKARRKIDGEQVPFYESVFQPFYTFWEDTHQMVFRGVNGYLPDDRDRPRTHIHHVNTDSLNNSPNNLKELTVSEHVKLHRELNPLLYSLSLSKGQKMRWQNPDNHKKQSEMMSKENKRRNDNPEYFEKLCATNRKRFDDEFNIDYNEIKRLYVEEDMSLNDISVHLTGNKKHHGKIKNRLQLIGVEIKPQLYHACKANKNKPKPRNEVGQFYNHKVVSIETYGKINVYDIEVPKYSNFALMSGVFVHNSDLKNAIKDVPRSSDTAKAKAWIKKRAKELDCEDCLPGSWEKATKDELNMFNDDIEKGGVGSGKKKEYLNNYFNFSPDRHANHARGIMRKVNKEGHKMTQAQKKEATTHAKWHQEAAKEKGGSRETEKYMEDHNPVKKSIKKDMDGDGGGDEVEESVNKAFNSIFGEDDSDPIDKAFESVMEVTTDSIERAFSDVLRKGGIGSGRKIGSTKSGKDIYDHFDHPAHKDFDISEHMDAKRLHDKKIKEYKKEKNSAEKGNHDKRNYMTIKMKHHEEQGTKHENTADEMNGY